MMTIENSNIEAIKSGCEQVEKMRANAENYMKQLSALMNSINNHVCERHSDDDELVSLATAAKQIADDYPNLYGEDMDFWGIGSDSDPREILKTNQDVFDCFYDNAEEIGALAEVIKLRAERRNTLYRLCSSLEYLVNIYVNEIDCLREDLKLQLAA